MTAAHVCLLVAAVLPPLCALIAKAGRFGFKENHDPRAWQARQTGWRARALAAQANGFEALPLFIGGLLVAWQREAAPATVDLLAMSFVGLRVVYIGLYLADLATLRSVAWIGAVGCAVALYFTGG